MNKVFLSLLVLLFSLNLNASQRTDEELLQSTLGSISLIQSRDDLSSTQKLQETLKDLEIIRARVSDEQFLEIFRTYEPELYVERTDPKARELIYLYVALNSSPSESWPYSKSRDELFNYLDSISSDLGPELKLISHITRFNVAQLRHQNEKSVEVLNQASIELEAIPTDSKDFRDIKFFFNFVLNMKKLDLAKTQGDLEEARKLSYLLDKDFEKMIPVTVNVLGYVYKKFNLNDIDQQSYRMRDTLLEALSYDKFLGKFDEVIRKSNLLLTNLDPYSKNRLLLRSRSRILAYQAQVYAKLGNIPAMQKAFAESIKIAIRSGYVPMDFLQDFIKLAIQNNDIKLAKFYVASLEKRLNSSEPEVRDLLVGIVPLQKEFLDQLAMDPQRKDELAKAYYLKAAAWQEKLYFGVFDDKPEYALTILYALHRNFLDAGDKKMAALYAKVYINKIQEVRATLSGIKDPNLVSFTEDHAERIKEFSNLFFDIGDFDSSFKCFRIIKENEYLDFVRRRDSSEKLLTKLTVSDDENDYLIQISAVFRQQAAIEKQLKTVSSGNEVDQLREALNNSHLRIEELKRKIASSKKKESRVATEEQAKFHEVNSLAPDEAFVEIYTSNDSVNSRVVTNKNISKIFIRKISQFEFRKLVLSVYNSFAKNQPISSSDLQKLSNLIIEDANNFLIDSGAKKVKVRLNDFYLNLIPIAQLKVNQKDFGEKYSISYVGLSLDGSRNIGGNIGLAGFAATKGNSNFSPLPGAMKEIEALKNITEETKTTQSSFFVDKDFNKVSLLNSFGKSGTIHLATHFQASGNTSDSTRMLLGDGSEMTLDDIRKNLPDLTISLVTLSACDTGNLIPKTAGSFASGGSYYDGLSSVFLTKGAQNVIATLWSIDDQATSDFMGIFYTLLSTKTVNEVEALSLTQAVFRGQSIKGLPALLSEQQKLLIKRFTKNIGKYSHPYYWAGFEIYTVN